MIESSDADALPPDCSVCLVEHDEIIHAATLSVHQWFRRQVVKYFDEDEPAARVA